MTAPTPPVNVMGVATSSTSIQVTWSEPARSNGVVRYYEVFYRPRDETDLTLRVTSPRKSVLLENLKTYTFYVILVRAYTVEVGENSSSIIVRTLQNG